MYLCDDPDMEVAIHRGLCAGPELRSALIQNIAIMECTHLKAKRGHEQKERTENLENPK